MPKASAEADKLWPYLVKKVERVARSTAGGAGAVGVVGAPSPHALESTHHTGVLADYQAPQFLLRDGARSLTGNLEVEAGITVDGVDISAHAANASAHHAPVTVGNGISLTGQLIAFKPKTTSGLVLDSGGAAVGAGDGIDVLTSTIAVDVTDIIDTAYGLAESSNNIRISKAIDSGLAFDGGGNLSLGTPSNVSASSVNSLAGMGISHSHAVTAASDVGTTPAASLLKSTGAGGLILATLTVKGSVDIIDGGDLTVGSNVLFVDVSQSSVGVMRAPDPQFALDVNGPIRGTEIVGKHAIQLDDLAVLLHYDGGYPFETNYAGEPNAVPMGTVPYNNTAVHYRPGKFYKCAVFGRSGTNLVTNPSFETATTGWSVHNDAGGDLSWSRTTEESWYGDYSAKLFWTTVNNSQFYNNLIAAASGNAYTFSVWMRALVPCSVELRIHRNGTPYAIYGTNTVNVTEEWQVFQVTGTPPAGIATRINMLPQGSGNTVYVDGVQMEESSYASWYMDGSLGSGYAWTGTAHASTSTRGNGRLSYNLTNMVAHRWSTMGYARIPNLASVNGVALWQLTVGAYKIWFYQGSGVLTCGVQHTSGTTYRSTSLTSFDPNVWYHFAATYDGTILRVYLDGDQVGTVTCSFNGGIPTQLHVGNANSNYGNVMIDDLLVSRQCLTAERIKAIYESDAPVFATSSLFSFRATPRGLVWADDEGLWMRDTDGDTVMGFYGGDAASKSWGGFTLEQGDIAFGRYGASDGGWFWFDRDGVSSAPYLRLGYSDKTVIAFDAAGASLDGVLDIGTSGGIYQGTGSFASPTTGLKLWNSSGVGRIAGYNSSTAQWYVNTDGKLYAGGGNVVLDSAGIALALDATDPIRFVDGSGVTVGSIKHRALSTPTRYEFQLAIGNATRDGVISLAANDTAGSDNVLLYLDATAGGFSGITTNGGNNQLYYCNGGGHIELGPYVYIGQLGATAALPALELAQYDLSEELIAFTGSVAGSNPINQSGLGTYWGRVRVSVNGTFYWLALYNT